jgi:predicted helicase
LAHPPWQHALVAHSVVDDSYISNKTKERTYVFPLWLFCSSERIDLFDDDLISGLQSRRPNLASDFIYAFQTVLNLSVADWQPENQTAKLNAEGIFKYIYAVLHSPTYRSRYQDFLRIDFPRIPLTGSLVLFHEISKLGGELVSLHLLESPKITQFITQFTGEGDNSIPKKPVYKDGAVWINANQRFENVPEAVWNFHIGGYQVCEKWLKDRKGRRLNEDDITHYQKIVVALNETIRLMQEIDTVIDQHGGWPAAFQPADN